MTCATFATPLSDATLQQCIDLVKQVSWRAQNVEFTTDKRAKIHHREIDNGWMTWFYPTSDTIDACCFFQKMKTDGHYSMCIGFNKTKYPMGTTGNATDCPTFLTTFMGNGTDDDKFCYFVKNCLGGGGVRAALLVDLPSASPDETNFNQVRTAFFNYVKANPNGPNWSFALHKSHVWRKFWGGYVDLWKLTVS